MKMHPIFKRTIAIQELFYHILFIFYSAVFYYFSCILPQYECNVWTYAFGKYLLWYNFVGICIDQQCISKDSYETNVWVHDGTIMEIL